jgi:hypothetical protein
MLCADLAVPGTHIGQQLRATEALIRPQRMYHYKAVDE